MEVYLSCCEVPFLPDVVALVTYLICIWMCLPGFRPSSTAGHAAGYAGGPQGDPAEAQLEPGRPLSQHLRQRGRQTDLPQTSGGAEHGLYKGQSGLHEGDALLGGVLVDATTRDARGGGSRHGGGTSSFGGLPEFGRQYGHIVGVGSR
jgi:hypothetical protein